MKKSSIIFLALGLSGLVWVLNYIALIFYLYWTSVWYDVLMHFMGGLAIGVVFALFIRLSNRQIKSFLTILFPVVLVGIAWELFEYAIGESFAPRPPEGYVLDTAIDLVMDALGAMTAYLITTSRSEESF